MKKKPVKLKKTAKKPTAPKKLVRKAQKPKQEDVEQASKQVESAEAKFAAVLATFTDEEKRILEETFSKEPTREKIVKRLERQYAIKEDELKVLYPTDEKLIKFYLEVASQAKNMTLDDSEMEQEDNYDLTDANKRDLEEIELARKRNEKYRNFQQAQQIVGSDPEAQRKYEEAQKHLPPEDRVPFADFLQGLKDGLQLEEDEEENEPEEVKEDENEEGDE